MALRNTMQLRMCLAPASLQDHLLTIAITAISLQKAITALLHYVWTQHITAISIERSSFVVIP